MKDRKDEDAARVAAIVSELIDLGPDAILRVADDYGESLDAGKWGSYFRRVAGALHTLAGAARERPLT